MFYSYSYMTDKPKVKYKCMSIFLDTKYNNVLDNMTTTSKNIYNTCVYHYNIYSLFKKHIYNDFINLLDINLTKIKDKNKYVSENYDTLFFQTYNKYYKLFNDNKIIFSFNNSMIYHIVKYNLSNKILQSNNIVKYEKALYDIVSKFCIFDDNNKWFVLDYNFNKILKSFYNKTYFLTKDQMLNHKPLTFNDPILINDIKNDNYYFKTEKFSKKNIPNKNKIKIKSDQGIFKILILHNYLNDNRKKLPSDVIGSIIDKYYANIKGYQKLIEKKIKANKPFFKKDKFNLIYTYRSFKQCSTNIRLTLGEHIAKNYNNLMKTNHIALNNREYYRKSSIKQHKIGKNSIKIANNKYINKTDIIDGYYMYIPLPKKIRNKNIKQIDIKPIYNGYKMFFSYEEPLDPIPINITNRSLQTNIAKAISIDTGMENLLTIYNPNGSQKIFKGNILESINNFYNKKINKLKSINKKLYDKNTFNRLYSLLEERKNKLYGHINKIINKLVETYKNKDIFIIGYNKKWKNKVNLGRNTNRRFYQIPYAYILEKLRSKLTKQGKHLIINEENYTSKCDALMLEKICKHSKYSGKRIERGLFKSGNGKVINADLNGAINIMRKTLYKLHPEGEECDLKNITGNKLYNPEIVLVN